jgi:hypothetical protein
MTTPLRNATQLTPNQRHQLAAVYQLILSWKRESHLPKASGDAQLHQPSSAPKPDADTTMARPKLRGVP